MKSPLVLLLLMLFAAGSYAAEENRIVKPAGKTQEDVFNALFLMGVNAYRFDLSSLLTENILSTYTSMNTRTENRRSAKVPRRF